MQRELTLVERLRQTVNRYETLGLLGKATLLSELWIALFFRARIEADKRLAQRNGQKTTLSAPCTVRDTG